MFKFYMSNNRVIVRMNLNYMHPRRLCYPGCQRLVSRSHLCHVYASYVCYIFSRKRAARVPLVPRLRLCLLRLQNFGVGVVTCRQGYQNTLKLVDNFVTWLTMKWRFQCSFSDWQPCLFSDNLKPLFKRNEYISSCFTGQDGSLVQGFLCPPRHFENGEGPGCEVA